MWNVFNHIHSGEAKVEMNKACIKLHGDQHDGCCFTNILDMVTQSGGSKRGGKWDPANLKLGKTAYCGIHKKQCLGFCLKVTWTKLSRASFSTKSTKLSYDIHVSCISVPTVSPPAFRCTISFSKEDLALVGAPCILFSLQQASNQLCKIFMSPKYIYLDRFT